MSVLAGALMAAGVSLMSLPALAGPERPARVASIDMCADQYALALVPLDHIAAVSNRVSLKESYYRDRATGLRRLEPSLENLLALKPDVVLRTWAGDFRLVGELERRGIRVVTIADVTDFAQARAELLRVGAEIGETATARIEAHKVTGALARTPDLGGGRSVTYYTPSGYSAGKGTFIGTMLEKLGFRMASARTGFYYLSPESMLAHPSEVYALGFYEGAASARRAPGRNPAVEHVVRQKPRLTLPDSVLACSAWYTAFELQDLMLEEPAR